MKGSGIWPPGRRVLSLLGGQIDLTGVEDDLSKFEEDVNVGRALKEGINLREYSRQIDSQLRAAEDAALTQYVSNSDCVADLFQEIETCDSILGDMETMLKGFQENLGGISSDIKKLQIESLSMNVKLRNRNSAEKKLSQFVQAVVISPDLVKAICDNPIDAKYVDHLVSLNSKIEYLNSTQVHPMQNSAVMDSARQVEILRQQAVTRTRDFLMKSIHALQQPKANVQSKQGILLKYRYFNEFLSEHAKPVALEIRTFYTNTMSALLVNFFKGYMANMNAILLKRKKDSLADKQDLLGVDLAKSSGMFSSKKTEEHIIAVFTLGDRKNVILTQTTAPIVRHLTEDTQSAIPLDWENTWNSQLHLLSNTAASEFHYLSEFFDNREMFNMVFSKTIAVVQSNLEQYLSNSFDIIGVLLTIRVCDHQRDALKTRRSSATNSYLDLMFDRFNLISLARFKALIDLQIASLSHGSSATAVEVSTRSPSVITRRFAALFNALVTLNSPPFNQIEMIKASLFRLRTEFTSFIDHIALSIQSSNDRLVYLVNQYECVSSALKDGGGCGDEQTAFDSLAAQYTLSFADQLLDTCDEFHRVIAFVKSSEAQKTPLDSVQLTSIIRAFSSRWRQGIETITRQVHSGQFSGNGVDKSWEEAVLKRVLLHLLQFYQRFDDLVRERMKGSVAILEELVPTQTVAYDIKKRLKQP